LLRNLTNEIAEPEVQTVGGHDAGT